MSCHRINTTKTRTSQSFDTYQITLVLRSLRNLPLCFCDSMWLPFFLWLSHPLLVSTVEQEIHQNSLFLSKTTVKTKCNIILHKHQSDVNILRINWETYSKKARTSVIMKSHLMCAFALTVLLIMMLILFVPLFFIYSHLGNLAEQGARTSLLEEQNLLSSSSRDLRSFNVDSSATIIGDAGKTTIFSMNCMIQLLSALGNIRNPQFIFPGRSLCVLSYSNRI